MQADKASEQQAQHARSRRNSRRARHQRNPRRRLMLVAALLVAAVLVGIVLTILVRNSQSGTPSAATSSSVGSVVYTRSPETGTNESSFIAWSPDSRRVATMVTDSQGQPTQLQIWDATTGDNLLTAPLTNTQGGSELLWSPTGRYLLLSNLVSITVIDAQTDAIVNTVNADAIPVASTSVRRQSLLSSSIPAGQGAGFYSVAWTPDGVYLAVAVSFASQGKVELLDPLTGIVQTTFNIPAYRVGTAIALSSDGHYLAVSYPNDGKMVVWNVSTQAVVLQEGGSQVETLAWQPGTYHLAGALLSPGETRVWDISSGKLLKKYAGVTNFTWSPDGRRLASYAPSLGAPGDSNAKTNQVAIIDAASGTQVALYKSKYPSIQAVSWSPDGRYIATAEGSTTATQILIWIA